jgi:hypothetical protein
MSRVFEKFLYSISDLHGTLLRFPIWDTRFEHRLMGVLCAFRTDIFEDILQLVLIVRFTAYRQKLPVFAIEALFLLIIFFIGHMEFRAVLVFQSDCFYVERGPFCFARVAPIIQFTQVSYDMTVRQSDNLHGG